MRMMVCVFIFVCLHPHTKSVTTFLIRSCIWEHVHEWSCLIAERENESYWTLPDGGRDVTDTKCFRLPLLIWLAYISLTTAVILASDYITHPPPHTQTTACQPEATGPPLIRLWRHWSPTRRLSGQDMETLWYWPTTWICWLLCEDVFYFSFLLASWN